MSTSPPNTAISMIAIDLDGTLLGEDGKVSPRNLAALHAAEAAGIEIVAATGRRHSYAMHVMRPLGLAASSALVSSNGTVTRTLGSSTIATESIACAHLSNATVLWLLGHIHEYRNALALTFDRVGPDGEDTRGALVVEHLEELTSSIGKWMAINEPCIALVNPIEQVLTPTPAICRADAPIQMMLCGTIARMARAEAHLRVLGAPPRPNPACPPDVPQSPPNLRVPHLRQPHRLRWEVTTPQPARRPQNHPPPHRIPPPRPLHPRHPRPPAAPKEPRCSHSPPHATSRPPRSSPSATTGTTSPCSRSPAPPSSWPTPPKT